MAKAKKAKNVAELKASVEAGQDRRADLHKQFGFIPRSVLHLGRGALSARMHSYQKETPSTLRSAAAMMGDDSQSRLRKSIGVIGGVKATQQDSARASTMPAELVDFCIKYYAKPFDNYLDPFMGQGVRMQVAKMRSLNYWGYDVSEDFFAYCEHVRKLIIRDQPEVGINITRGDSRTPLDIPDGIGDFSFTSPPYWDIEFYGNEPEQLGTNSTYPAFLESMYEVAKAWHPKFKAGAWVVVNVNDFRREGKFYSYHTDTIALYGRAGYTLHDTWIIEGLVGGMNRLFAVDFNLKRIAPKNHEYLLVFKA